MSLVPGLGIVRGMSLTLRRFFEPKATVMYPEVRADVAVKFRGRLQLLLDEHGALKCETCFQCAQACPIECIDMGGLDTKGRFHVHWGPPETYGERREESAIRRSGRTVPDPVFASFEATPVDPVDAILERYDYDPKHLLPILEATQAEYGHLPVAAIKKISQRTGAWYAMIYGAASYYGHLRFESPEAKAQVAALAARRPSESTYLDALGASLGGTSSGSNGGANGGSSGRSARGSSGGGKAS
jgi:uncharacterized membrane protein YgcG